MAPKQFWLMKSEPSTYSINNLQKSPKYTCRWEGVRNYQARNFMRDNMQLKDQAFFYHSSCPNPGIVGIVQIVKTAYPDFSAWDKKSPYFDPKSTQTTPRWFMVDIQLIEKFSTIIALSTLKHQSQLQNMLLLRPGNRLSIMPVTAQEWRHILTLKT